MNEKQYVVFKIENELYGMDILRVNSITELMDITKLPNYPQYIKGIVNLRGDVIPILDLKNYFSIKSTNEISHDSRIIIYEANNQKMGFQVDNVAEVITIDEESIEDAPLFSENKILKYIEGIAKLRDRIVILLDLESIVVSMDDRLEI